MFMIWMSLHEESVEPIEHGQDCSSEESSSEDIGEPSEPTLDSRARLVYTLVWGSTAGSIRRLWESAQEGQWDNFMYLLVLMVIGVLLGIRVGFRVLHREKIVFRPRIVFYSLVIVVVTASPVLLYILIRGLTL
ncbi:MAG: hypothetical protein KatS3mg016_1984 [Fimbriimonadales bacterium]|nr:MAG: hypothetical protein KatS3mg016_1984 [Fimbriimonadales bacterium]GIV06949.1 MAG: hypothetical protein KatS3mg017_0151 [Fimbriimonadales bacterium]